MPANKHTHSSDTLLYCSIVVLPAVHKAQPGFCQQRIRLYLQSQVIPPDYQHSLLWRFVVTVDIVSLDGVRVGWHKKRIKLTNLQNRSKKSSERSSLMQEWCVFRRDRHVLQPIHPSILNIRAIIIFSERGSERYFLQLATFTVIMTHSMFICQSFFAVKTGCFVFHLSLITHGTISHHHHPEKGSKRDLDARPAANSSRNWELDRNSVISRLMQDFQRFQEWALSFLLWAQGWRKHTNLLVTTSYFTKRIPTPGPESTRVLVP